MSGGERQLTLIARALAQEPQVLVMDEPTASLDFGNQVRVLSEIKTLAGRGIAVILSTHDPDQAFLCAQRVASAASRPPRLYWAAAASDYPGNPPRRLWSRGRNRAA